MSSTKNYLRGVMTTSMAMLLSAIGTQAAWAQTNPQELNKELEIMTTIFKTALDQSKQQSIKVRDIDVIYLADQGVVFELNTSLRERNFVFEFAADSEFRHLAEMPVPPIPPIPSMDGEHEFEVGLSDQQRDWSDSVEEAMQQAREAAEQAREQLRELRHREREYGWELRDKERQLRDLEFEMRTADEQRKQELNEQKQQLSAEIAQLKTKQSSIEQQAEKVSQARKAQQQHKLAARKQQYDTFLANFETILTDTLCKYGNGLSSLPAQEHVNVVLKGVSVTGNYKDKQDRIYVFTHQDIQACSKDKLSAEKLLGQAQSYLF